MASERVQKILAQVGIASRRKAEDLISQGLVTVNGRVIELGEKAELGKDAIKVDGKLIGAAEKPVYIAFHKPKAVISMLEDPEGRPALSDYLTKIRGRIFPIGRLDFMSEGLLLLTNDGAFAEKIQKHDDIPRIYHVKVKGHPDAEMLSRVERGLRVDSKLIKPHSVRVAEELTSKAFVEVVMLGGGATDLKALFELKGFLVEKIVRAAIGHLSIEGLAPGEYRLLTATQVQALLDQPELGLQKLEAAREEEAERKKRKARGAARAEGFRRAEGKFSRTSTSRGKRPLREETERPKRTRAAAGRDWDSESPKRPRKAEPNREPRAFGERGPRLGTGKFGEKRTSRTGGSFGTRSEGRSSSRGAWSKEGREPRATTKRGFDSSFGEERKKPSRRGFGAKPFGAEKPAQRGFAAKRYESKDLGAEKPARRGPGGFSSRGGVSGGFSSRSGAPSAKPRGGRTSFGGGARKGPARAPRKPGRIVPRGE